MEQLIPIASKLQDVLGALGQTTSLDLPQIVVVGGQSSGKSSVLESLVGRSFLPRGTGIVTRRPLVLQLFNTHKEEGGDSREWGEFLHKPGHKYFDFSEIRKEIIAETDRLTGNNRGIDRKPIHLKIFSPRVLALTLVDLPGIAKVPVGDQPLDIERQIHDMCVRYISNPNAIILAVTSANTDLANSDALKLAGSIDPDGNRTVGVLTKIDLMDEGTDCADILMNQVIPLRRGYIAVVNRGQKDVQSDLSIQEGLKKEDSFFRKHPVYSRDRALLTKCGTSRLSKSLNTMLMHHIKDCLPDLKARISGMMSNVNKELDALGSPAHNLSRSSRGAALLSLLSRFATNFGKILEGRVGEDLDTRSRLNDKSNMTGSFELMGGARISYIFTQVFSNALTSVGAFDGLSDDEIRTIICNANGTRPALFVPEVSFDILVRRQIARLEQPGIQCVDMIFEELQRIASQSEPSELTRFPVLRDRMVEVVATLLRRCVGPTQMMVANLVKIELAYINTSHPDFIGGSRAVARLMEKMGKENNERKLRPAEREAVGATPLSSSSLNNYGYEDATGENGEFSDAVMSPTITNDKNVNPGLMNFIFGGNNNSNAPGSAVRANSAPPKKSTFKKSLSRKSLKPSFDPTTTPAADADTEEDLGPPTIVHLSQIPDTMKYSDLPTGDRERVEMEVIKSLVESYFCIVRKNYIDLVPKTIMYFLVNHVRDTLQNELVSELYREAEMGHLLKETDDIAQRRQTCNEMKELLGKAMEIVNEVRDFNSFK